MATRTWERGGAEPAAVPAGPARSATSATVAEGGEEGAGGGAEAAAGEALSEATPGRRKRRMLTESHLLSAEGLKKVHRSFSYQVPSDVAGQEAKALKALVNMYKQWAFDLYPGLNFDDFLERAEFLGRSHGVQGLMADLRDKERRRALRLDREAEEDADEAKSEHDEPLADALEPHETEEAML